MYGRNILNEAFEMLTSKSAEDEILSKLENEELKKIVDELPEKQRRRIKMRFFENMTFAEIAKIERCSESSVKSMIFDVLKKVKKLL